MQAQLAALELPAETLDWLLEELGNVAELSGRSSRLERLADGRVALRERRADANAWEMEAFQSGAKRIAVSAHRKGL